MSEHIDNKNVFDSGGHRWSWAERHRRSKVIAATGVAGEGSFLLHTGGRPGVIAGLLKATASDFASANAALNALEAGIEALADSGLAYLWEDDVGHSGKHLKVANYKPAGERICGQSGAGYEAWQHYQIEVIDLDGNR